MGLSLPEHPGTALRKAQDRSAMARWISAIPGATTTTACMPQPKQDYRASPCLCLKEIERLKLRIAELENQNRQQAAQQMTARAEKPLPNPARVKPSSHSQPPEMMNEHKVAAFLKMRVASVRRWRLFRTGPKFVKIGSAVRYRRNDLDGWLDSCAAIASEQ
jgi:hypothetical protein